MKQIEIRGARTHNLKNIDLDLPRDQLVVVTGLSGSGKSSLAFDTLYAEGQRRYVESLSTYARQFLSMMEKPDVDHIEGLSPAISIEQKSTSHNPRSTVGTVTEIYDYLRLLFARVGTPRCPTHGVSLEAQEVSQMVDQLMTLEEGTKLMVLAPVVTSRKGTHEKLLTQLRIDGYVRIRLNGEIIELDEAPKLKKTQKHDIDVVVDRLKVRHDINVRLAESLETALNLADGIATAYLIDKGENIVFSQRLACAQCGYSVAELEPRLFSFNNPVGACPSCDGLGVQSTFDPDKVVVDQELSLGGGAIRSWNRQNHYYFNLLTALADYYGFDTEKPFKKLSKKVQKIILYGSGEEILPFHYPGRAGTVQTREHSFEGILPNMQRRYHETDSGAVRDELAKYLSTHACEACAGTRLREEARHVYIDEVTLPVVAKMSIEKAYDFFGSLEFTGWRQAIALKIQKEIGERLGFLVNVGLNYLTLERSADTLSGGEAQRIRLASQIGAGLVGVMYVLDEPSIGLHQRDNERLLKTLTRLRDLGNTVIVVEHDEDAIRLADYVIDMGPGAGVHGGHVIAKGKPKQIMKSPHSLTGQYLSGKRKIHVPNQRAQVNSERMLTVTGACGNNLHHVSVEIPLGLFTCITGVSGSGKSTLINETLYPLAARKLNGATIINPAPYESVSGLEYLDKVVAIDQSPIGRTPRSNPATYTGIFTAVRDLFSGTAEARSRGYKPGRFSFNVKGGRCEACQGDGVIRVEMHFLPDVYVSCDVCHGKRYNRETLEVRYKGKNIHEALDLTVEDACEFFSVVPSIARKAQTLLDVGLGYIKLGQSATTLSGGEAQRVKLAKELSRRDTGQTLYILDEPTTGLHFYDIEHLLDVLSRLKERGNSIVVIEHNLDVIKTADWIVDLGPEGGDGGGRIIAAGTPEDVAKVPGSYTGQFLVGMLN